RCPRGQEHRTVFRCHLALVCSLNSYNISAEYNWSDPMIDANGNLIAQGSGGENHPNREHDTVAQQPTHVHAGTATTPPHPDAHLPNSNRTPGAHPPDEADRAKLREPHRVAGGRPALAESL